MAQSFYLTRNYAQLRNASQVFNDLINGAAVSYGLTVLQAAAYETLNDDYAVKFGLWDAPLTRTKTTMYDRNNSAELLKAKAAELAKIIEANPAVTDGQKAGLGLNVRAERQPAPAPGTCNDFKTELQSDGSIIMTWKANNPPRVNMVTYQVYRRFGSEGEFTFIGGSGEKKFVDGTIPAGTAQVQYRIRGVRPTGTGAWADFNVNFGQSPSGTTTASVVEKTSSPKLAA